MANPRLALLLIALVLVLLPWLLWRLRAVRAVAPLAVVQILAGVLLGPSGLGRLAPDWHAALFPPPVLGALSGLATLGVVLYVLVSGLHLDLATLRDGARRLAAPALGSMLLPLALGAGAAAWIAGAVPGALGPRGDLPGFVAAIALCLAVTALPVLAAILREMGLIAGRLGQTALALAALNDAALWLLIAVTLALSHGSGAEALRVTGLAALWVAALGWGARPLLARLAARHPEPGTMLVVALAVTFASAAAAEAIEMGYIIGAFAAGTVIPAAWRAPLLARLEPLVAAALLPFFFVFTGLRALIEPDSAAFLGLLAVVTAATVVGKVAGTALPARWTGEPWPSALALGALMQAKGLMEVVVLAVLLEAGLIGQPVFSALVAMAILCTVAATPLARLALARGAAPAPPGATRSEGAAGPVTV
ncbi:cation:proton antiporter [Roseomonas sp. OT10]|uniref:cation:proton antiporter n=1 Tax=Roseomonas cutis TaxID=2897332 RepID=UPI001E3706D5|nr:cation:proton antiporter [Roseomonas sp. OT10]UFN48245.1 cation:proton antiporter [Roseomonas sp. OT10]